MKEGSVQFHSQLGLDFRFGQTRREIFFRFGTSANIGYHRIRVLPSGNTARHQQFPILAGNSASPQIGIRPDPLMRPKCPHHAGSRGLSVALRPTADRLTVAAPTLVRRILHHPAAHRIEIDVTSDGLRRHPVFHDHAFEPVFPETTGSRVRPVVVLLYFCHTLFACVLAGLMHLDRPGGT